MPWFKKPIKLTLQVESTECGLACLAMISSSYGRKEGMTDLRRRFPTSLSGVDLRDLISIADSLGFFTRAVRCDLAEIKNLHLPCILHWNLDHFVVLKSVGSKGAEILDPARGERKLSFNEISKHFTGVALELTPSPNFEKKDQIEKVRLNDLWSSLQGFTPMIIQMFFLTLALQIFGLLMPVANQVVVDDVIGRGDQDLLLAILIGFGLVVFLQTAIDMLRNLIQLYAGQKLSVQLTGNLLRHMMKLPTSYFERRHVGDILTRFNSLGPVQSFLTGGVVGAVLDAIMIVPAGVIMFMYSPVLSMLVVLDLVLVGIVQLATFHRSRRFTDEAITLGAKTQSIFLETLRAIRTIKLAGRESERHSIWQNAVTDQQNLGFRQAVFNLWGSSGFGLVMAAQGLFMLYLGATEVIKGHMTLGMLMAFQSYAGQFSGRSKSLIGQFFTFKMLGLHLERLADIVHAPAEINLAASTAIARPIEGRVEISQLKFRYSPRDPWVLKGLSLNVERGEHVVLIGPSGGGKSTLLKLMTGLYQPDEGEVLIDGVPLTVLGLTNYRSQIGVVMQDDELLSGTLADNVAFFDPLIDMSRVEEACKIAHIHADIMRLPMAYHSLIGDMGSILSGGQKQRVLLARALYDRPKILFVDEGTANLDPALELSILQNLRELGITQITIAHRPAAERFADRVLALAEGVIANNSPKVASDGR